MKKRSRPPNVIHDKPKRKKRKLNKCECECEHDDEDKEEEGEEEEYKAPSLQNSVSVVNLGTTFNENHFSQVMQCFEFLRHKFAATTFRLTTPPMTPNFSKKATGLLYLTGNFIIVGATSKVEANVIYSIYRQQIGKIRKRVFEKDENGKYTNIKFVPLSRLIKAGEMKTPNTVYKTNFDQKKIYLDEIWRMNQEITRYSPEAFPGARIHGKDATFLIFQEGACLILGLRDTTSPKSAYLEMKNYIDESYKSKKNFREPFSLYLWKLDNSSDETSGKSQTVKRKVTSKRDNVKRDLNNFEKRLSDHYSSYNYVNTTKKIEDGLENKYRDTIDLDDFVVVPMKSGIMKSKFQ